ncbi:thrombomodulin-like [Xyrichtys novacula]|uniref:Thrombomodulin-like n=1 Tax=Xyrichtys novacula TaxID=13765 RepID=A0AAV1GUZ4_XYRNO|nr:thrombomodulin-like [Xyrichtys novacula]
MVPTVHALIICVFFLFRLDETVEAQRGRCNGGICFALFWKPTDFSNAKKSCEGYEGYLFSYNTESKALLSGLVGERNGSYWLETSSTGERKEEAALRQNCSSISVSKGENLEVTLEPCRKELDGFLCGYTSSAGVCAAIKTGKDAQVTYSTPYGFEAENSDVLPFGTVAVVKKIDPCAGCTHGCQPEGDTYACTCRQGYRLNPDGKTCECKDDFVEEGGVCVNNSICYKCEHDCYKHNGVYQCKCRTGYRVKAEDPTKCEEYCGKRQCLASSCLPKMEGDGNSYQCYCQKGYVHEHINNTNYCTDIDECLDEKPCSYRCENLYGGFRCSCESGFEPYNGYKCKPIKKEEGEEEGSGLIPLLPTPASAHPASVPSYIKTGSVLGISVFMALFAGLLYFLVRHMVKRCGKFQLSSLKHHDIDIFYLQQATTGTYKRFSFDRQLKNDPDII